MPLTSRARCALRRAAVTASALTTCTAGPREGSEPPAGASAVATLSPGIEAIYVLDSIAGQPLPATEDEPVPGQPRLEVLAETLWLRRDGSFAARSHWRETRHGRSSLGVYADSGRYTLEQSPTVSASGLLLSGDVVLRSPPNRRATLWARNDGHFLVGPGLPRPPGGTAILVPFTYRRVPRPGR